MNSGNAIEVRSLEFAYSKDVPLLSIPGFTLGKGEVTAVVGKSGCGKSTFLKLLSGQLEAGSGESIEIDGSLAYLAQSDTSFPWLSTRQNIEFPLRRCGWSKSRMRSRSDQLLDLVNLGHVADSYPDALSGGMRQRMLLARTLAASPAITLLDEPFGALDLVTRQAVENGLRRLLEDTNAGSMIIVTHDIDNALSLADRILILGGEPATFVNEVENLKKERDPYNARVRDILDYIK